MGAGDDLIALYWTTSGPVEVHFGREWSLFDLRDRCEQAARVGFRGIGLWHADLEHVLESRTLQDVRSILDEYAPDAGTFAGALALPPDQAGLAATIRARVVDKLTREPVEDYRIDFEDGYGVRPDAEEDHHAHSVAEEVAAGVAESDAQADTGAADESKES